MAPSLTGLTRDGRSPPSRAVSRSRGARPIRPGRGRIERLFADQEMKGGPTGQGDQGAFTRPVDLRLGHACESELEGRTSCASSKAPIIGERPGLWQPRTAGIAEDAALVIAGDVVAREGAGTLVLCPGTIMAEGLAAPLVEGLASLRTAVSVTKPLRRVTDYEVSIQAISNPGQSSVSMPP